MRRFRVCSIILAILAVATILLLLSSVVDILPLMQLRLDTPSKHSGENAKEANNVLLDVTEEKHDERTNDDDMVKYQTAEEYFEFDHNYCVAEADGTTNCVSEAEVSPRMLFSTIELNYDTAADILDPTSNTNEGDGPSSNTEHIGALNLLEATRAKWRRMNHPISNKADESIGQIVKFISQIHSNYDDNNASNNDYKLYETIATRVRRLKAIHSEVLLGDDNKDTAFAFTNLGHSLRKQGRYWQAARAYQKAAIVFTQATSSKGEPPNEFSAMSHFNVGTVLFENGNVTKAMFHTSKGASICHNSLEPDHQRCLVLLRDQLIPFLREVGHTILDTPLSSNNVAWEDSAKSKEAVEFLKSWLWFKAIGIPVDSNNEHNQQQLVADLYYVAGSLRERVVGDLTGALEDKLESANMFEQTLGNNHPQTSFVYNDIGEIFVKLGQDNEAITFYAKSLPGLEKHCIQRQRYNLLLQQFEKMSGVRSRFDDVDGIMADGQRVADLVGRELGPDHADTPTIYHKIGQRLEDLGHDESALLYYEKALMVLQHQFGSDHATVGSMQKTIGKLHLNIGDHAGALESFRDSLRIFEQDSGTEDHSSKIAMLHFNIGHALFAQEEYSAAEAAYRKAVSIDPNRLEFNALLGAVIYQLCRDKIHQRDDVAAALSYIEEFLGIYLKLGAADPTILDPAQARLSLSKDLMEKRDIDAVHIQLLEILAAFEG